MALKDRAETEAQKIYIIAHLLEAWLKRPTERLGQLLINSLKPKQDLFYLEDYELIEQIDAMSK